MRKKVPKIIVDSLMLITLIITLVTMRGNMIVHTVIGGMFTLLMAIHIFQTIKWTKAMSKNFKKIKPKIRRQYIVNKVLITMWVICIITGILAGVHTLTGIDALFPVRRIHGITGAVAFALTIVHCIQHSKRLIGLFKFKRPRPQAA
ncbi:MAG: hypothetical protein FWE45_04985 [Firmicutes bacterium]|nr:hypothetical protein [Bacillota bacterium]